MNQFKAKATFLIGLSGSGKSTWCQHEGGDAVVLSGDQVRVRYLQDLKEKGEFFFHDGKYLTPNPKDPLQVFSPSLRHLNEQLLFEQLERVLKSGQSVILDTTNLTLTRVPKMLLCYAYNYWVEAVIFPIPTDLMELAKRIEQRGKEGGLDLAAGHLSETQKLEKRLNILQEMKTNFINYCQDLKQDALCKGDLNCDIAKLHSKVCDPKLDLSDMKQHLGTLKEYVLKSKLEKQKFLEYLISYDVFNEISRYDNKHYRTTR